MYQKLVGDEETGEREDVTVGAASSNPLGPDNGIQIKTFGVKILLKEACLQLPNLNDQTTVGQLKAEVETLTKITVNCQRLIFSGKQLKPDDKTIKSFNIVANSSIHLFPIPTKPVVENSAEAVADGGTAQASTLNTISSILSTHYPDNDQSISNDPEISQHCREVQLWSIILILLSCMTLFNNLTLFSTGTTKLQ